VKFLRPDLGDDAGHEDDQEDQRRDQVSQVHRHGDSVAAGLAQGSREDLDDPESQRDRGDLYEQRFFFVVHANQVSLRD
jgi:hypothetical protein